MRLILIFLVGNICLHTFSQDLFKLVKKNDIEAVTVYEDAVNLRDTNQATVLMWAAYRAELKMVELLIEKGADVHAKGWIIWKDTGTEYIYGSLMAIAGGENKLDLLKYLVQKQKIAIDDKEINLREGVENGWTALQWAAVRGNNDVIKYLLKKGAYIDEIAEMDFNRTALFFSVINNKDVTAMLLVKSGADINKLDSDDRTALFYSFQNKNKVLVKYLLEQGGSLNGKNNEGIAEMLLKTFQLTSIDQL